MGDSAGGCLSVISAMAINCTELRTYILDSKDTQDWKFPKIKAIVDLYGANDRKNIDQGFFFGHDLLEEMVGEKYGAFEFEPSQVRYSNAITPCDFLVLAERFKWTIDMPPLMVLHGTEDGLGPSSTFLKKALEGKTENLVEEKIYEKEKHGFFSFYWRENAIKATEDILQFLVAVDPHSK